MSRPFSTTSIDATLAALREQRPAYGDLINVFGPLLRAREQLASDFAAESENHCPQPPIHTVTAQQQGVHQLAGNDLRAWSGLVERSAETLFPILGEMLHISQFNTIVRNYLNAAATSLTDLVRARLEGDEPTMTHAAEAMNMPPEFLAFTLENILAPVLAAVAANNAEPASWGDWTQSSCPICGSLPAFAYLSLREPAHTDQIVSGGGRKHLHCSLCGHDWRVRRDACPACGTSETEKRELLFAEETPRERIEACHYCGSYCLCIDLREYENIPALDAVPLSLLHLDILAQGKTLHPLARNTWNTLK